MLASDVFVGGLYTVYFRSINMQNFKRIKCNAESETAFILLSFSLRNDVDWCPVYVAPNISIISETEVEKDEKGRDHHLS
jgi:hypothetical protein